jgi:gliding motility-associated-like protein
VVSIFGGEEPFQFSINGSAWSDVSEFDQLPEGTYLVNVQDQNGCDYDTTITLTAPDLLTLDLGGDVTATFGEIVEITAQTNLPFDQIDTIIWEGVNVDDLCGNVCESLTLLPINGQSLTATVISVNGCTISDQIFFQIKTDRQVYIPNVFTPNEDLLNTMFIPVDKKEIKIIQEMRIFSRWGEEIFTDFNIQANQDNGWDGTFKGQEMPQGVYLYYFKIEYVDGKVLPFVGDVTLLR